MERCFIGLLYIVVETITYISLDEFIFISETLMWTIFELKEYLKILILK